MKLIALTGGIGSGKSTVLNEFKKLGAEVMSCDEISHRIMLRGGSAYTEVTDKFGSTILNEDKEIDRKRLAAIVFSDNEKLELLNRITHRLIYAEIDKQIKESSAAVVCVEIPLLFTTVSPLEIDLKIAVVASEDIRIKRVMERDGMSADEVRARMAKQLSDDEMRKKADCVIENNGDMETLCSAVKEIYYSMI